MMFTSIQLIVIYIATLIIIYSIILEVLKTIKHCSTARAYTKISQGYHLKLKDLDNFILRSYNENDKENKQDGNDKKN